MSPNNVPGTFIAILKRIIKHANKRIPFNKRKYEEPFNYSLVIPLTISGNMDCPRTFNLEEYRSKKMHFRFISFPLVRDSLRDIQNRNNYIEGLLTPRRV